jgi:hypothetical protein
MKNQLLKFAAIFAALISGFLFSSCAHHRDVRPGADGTHRVVIPTPDKDEGSREAIDQANHYCGTMNKSAAFVEEKTNYKGDIPEESYNTGKKISKVAKVVGGSVFAFGGKNESNLGGIVGLGGAAGDAALGNGYSIEMKFKCQ